jgi:hypothetical protein
VWTKLDEGIMIISTEDAREKVLKLNKTAACIWEMADGALPVQRIIEHVSQTFDVDSETASADAAAFIEDMKSRNLLTVSATAV